ncbi:MAG: hypothetical protein WKF89_10990 [Chitinophagaceae bacterium]
MIKAPNKAIGGLTNLYCEARFWRPTGLGNRLFSWARAKIFSELFGCPMLTPEWAHLRGASIVRGGINYSNAHRKILLVDNFIAGKDEIKGWEKFRLRRTCVTLPVVTLAEAFAASTSAQDNILISFKGNTGHTFDELWMHRELIFSSLNSITKNKWFAESGIYQEPFVGINVRMGNDFKKAAAINDFLTQPGSYLRTPLSWYIESLRKTRELLGFDLKGVVISDGTEKDLRILLSEPNMSLCSSRSAIGDLMVLIKAKVLLGAGRSSFSAWASFLGQVPTITIPGSDLQGYHVSNDLKQHYVGEFYPEDPSIAYRSALNQMILS